MVMISDPWQPTAADIRWIRDAVTRGARQVDVAKHLGISHQTLRRRAHRIPELAQALVRPLDPCGTPGSYKRGCRCAPCIEAYQSYNRAYNRTRGKHAQPQDGVEGPRIHIEQAIARGLTTSQIMARLGVTYEQVWETRQGMEDEVA